ncbi:protein PALS1-like isoform X2 [Panonychus citri]|nr:protein PALS1-like isoform X2 [Panonychus citri]
MELVDLITRNLNSGKVQIHRGHHREVPVDVPESFVGMVKQKPRYPPPPEHRINNHPPAPPNSTTSLTSTQQISSSTSITTNNNNTTTIATNITTSAAAAATTSSSSSSSSNNVNNSNNDDKTMVDGETHCRSSPSSKTKLDADKLRKYSEDISRKKTEDEFLRTSLRQSKKLKQLEHIKRKVNQDQDNTELSSAVNDAFEGDDEVFDQTETLPSIDLNPILDRVVQQLNDELKELVTKTDLTKLVDVYNNIMQQKQKQLSLPCVSIPATDLLSDIVMLSQKYPESSEAAELLEILTRFELEGLCFAYDRIVPTVKDFQLSPLKSDHQTITNGQDVKMEIEDTLNSGLDPNVRIVIIEKSTAEPLGATVRNESDGRVIIGRIVKGGAAENSGLLHEGDEILEVNGIEMKGRNINQVCDLLAEMIGTLTFVINSRDQIATNPSIDNHSPRIYLKALFDYDPDDDVYIPCRELGLCFSKGDILDVIDQTDTNWWQAYRFGEQDQSLAGLIPSVHFQLQRDAMQQSMLLDSNNTSAHNYKNHANKKSASSILFNCGKRYHNRRKKHRKMLGLVSGTDESLTYEEVSIYYPRANIKRPIVLIGPTNIGRHELRQKLMQDSERFAAAIPHTSRPRRDGEISGIDYHFISRQAFEQDIKDGKFVEHGQFEKNYYGTSLSAIEAVVQSGKICVLNLHVQAIPMLRQGHAGAKLKPYIVFVAPPTNIETLKRVIASTYRGQEEGSNLPLSELQSIIDEARDIEARFGHHFDKVLVVNEIEQAYQELLRVINVLERDSQWIPSIWLK